MGIRYLRAPYIQSDGTQVYDCEVDLHSEIPQNMAVGSRVFCREHNVDHAKSATTGWLDGAGGTPTPAAHNHDSAYAALSHTHAGGGQAFPVGAVFIAVVSTNPATLLGYGTWAAFGAGRMLVGLDATDASFDVVEETGGAKTHTHSNHAAAATAAASAGATQRGTTSSTLTLAAHTHQTPVLTHTTDSSLPPYIVVHMWKRTA